ncbi:aminotransferase class III-fold pyridoxal phosphate-dependent enzyme [Candidatus Nitrososphaera evergladensis]|uniref:aminotransferase class III-fold pyridoxal phosphate-dependent enzyme n=1 Tax=Candidatus Nitrososphaera evergladensis TaxID=1459637 RepID=UPI000AF0305A|nr:aminotransferase class III-fold pyridoxal phosphate-dependent enzyme [Candidatus Nitrososphaera evergladensis]
MKYAKISGELPGPIASDVIATMKKNCYDSTFTYPLVIASGSGCVVKDVDGNSFLDFTSNIGACPLGYSHPDVIGVIAEMSRNGAHKIAGQDFYCKEHADLAEQFVSVLPDGFKAFFINSGAEAVENAIKIAYRKGFAEGQPVLPGVSCTGAFHGRTLGALSFTYSKPVQKAGFPELAVLRIKFCTSDGDQEIDAIEKALAGNKVAFVLTEIVQGEGGYNIASQRFVQNLRDATKKHGVPLILDEVQSGMGRTGKWWAFEHYGVLPDIMSAAKALQVGATAYKSEYDPDQHGVLSSTWGGGSRIDLAVGATVIEVIKRDRLLANVLVMGERLKKGLADLAAGKKGIIDVRGLGLMIGIEFDTKENRDAVLMQAFRRGLLLLPAGQKAMRVIPPLVITAEEVDEGLELMATAAAASL